MALTGLLILRGPSYITHKYYANLVLFKFTRVPVHLSVLLSSFLNTRGPLICRKTTPKNPVIETGAIHPRTLKLPRTSRRLPASHRDKTSHIKQRLASPPPRPRMPLRTNCQVPFPDQDCKGEAQRAIEILYIYIYIYINT